MFIVYNGFVGGSMGKFNFVIDPGVSSLGFCAFDDQLNIIKHKGKSVYGVRLFNEAQDAKERRSFRANRRRAKRQKIRNSYLRDIFAEEVLKVDKDFFVRLDESGFLQEDKSDSSKFMLFKDPDFNDKDFYKKYPTIYHAKKAFLENLVDDDIRVLVLILLHYFKNRGHFLFEGEISASGTLSSSFETLSSLCKDFEIINSDIDEEVIEDIKSIFLEKSSLNDKKKKIRELCSQHFDEYEFFTDLFILACGGTVNLDKLFKTEDNEEYFNNLKEAGNNPSFTFIKPYEETRDEAAEYAGDIISVLDAAYEIHNSLKVIKILGEHTYYSESMVARYDKHKSDLFLLKKFVRKYCRNKYQLIFGVCSKSVHNYASYVKHSIHNGKKKKTINKTTQEDFCKFLIKNLSQYFNNLDKADTVEFSNMINDIQNCDFMPKLKGTHNSVIPMQLNLNELKVILKNASVKFPFLNKTEDGLTVKEKIIQLFKFKLPYYFGPLSSDSQFSWAVRKEDSKVYPWNIEKVIDVDKTAENFIDNLSNHCTYLKDQKVLPKESLIYSKYLTFNEINNLRINGQRLDSDTRHQIFEELYLKHNKVTKKALIKWLSLHKSFDKDSDQLTGISDDLHASMRSYCIFKKILGDNFNSKYVEEAIYILTVFPEDKKLIRNRLLKIGNRYFKDTINTVTNLKLSGWGRLSKKLLIGLQDENGFSILDVMEKEGLNLMEVLEGTSPFKNLIVQSNNCCIEENGTFYERYISSAYANAAAKRTAQQALLVIDDVVKTLKQEPEVIYIESTRFDGIKGRNVSPRKTQLQNIYKKINGIPVSLLKELDLVSDAQLSNDKVYLYFLQMGKDLYTGEPIDLNTILYSDRNNCIYDADHIVPRSAKYDDSPITNLALTDKRVNGRKSADYPVSLEIREKMKGFWKKLVDCKLMSPIKYQNLMRTTPLTDEELAGFINAQLTSTSQTCKLIKDILLIKYPNTKVVFVKASAVKDFKDNFDLVKVRDVNDLHHAKDAYAAGVYGYLYTSVFTDNPMQYIKENSRRVGVHNFYKYPIYRNGQLVWTPLLNKDGVPNEDPTINKVSDYYYSNDIIVTMRTYFDTGHFFNLNYADKDNAKFPKKKDPRFKNLAKYGGWDSINSSCHALVILHKKKTEMRLIPIPCYVNCDCNNEIIDFISAKFILPKESIEVISLLPRRTVLNINGNNYYLAGGSIEKNNLELHNQIPLKLNSREQKCARDILRFLAIGKGDSEDIRAKCGLLIKSIKKKKYLFPVQISNVIDLISFDKMMELDTKELCECVNKLFAVFSLNGKSVDLSNFGSLKEAGRIRISNNVTGKLNKIFHYSPSGLNMVTS